MKKYLIKPKSHFENNHNFRKDLTAYVRKDKELSIVLTKVIGKVIVARDHFSNSVYPINYPYIISTSDCTALEDLPYKYVKILYE